MCRGIHDNLRSSQLLLSDGPMKERVRRWHPSEHSDRYFENVLFRLQSREIQKAEHYRIMEYACHPLQLLYGYIHGIVIPLYHVTVYQRISTTIIEGSWVFAHMSVWLFAVHHKVSRLWVRRKIKHIRRRSDEWQKYSLWSQLVLG